jgi:hypothetical protein
MVLKKPLPKDATLGVAQGRNYSTTDFKAQCR